MMCDMFIIENYYPKWIVIMIYYMGNSHVVSYDHHCSLLILLFSWSQIDSHPEDLVYLPLLRLGHCILGLVWSWLQSSRLPESSSLFF